MVSRPKSNAGLAIVLWAVLGVAAMLGQAVVRLLPRALEPILDGSLDVFGILAYAASIIGLGYGEGYRGFQQRFSPRVVVRAFELARGWSMRIPAAQSPDPPAGIRGWLVVVAPLMTMGLVHATRRRLIASWALLLGIVGLVLLVHMLEQPWRGAVDAGVVVGLSWGTIATLLILIRALRGQVPDIDPELPGSTKAAK